MQPTDHTLGVLRRTIAGVLALRYALFAAAIWLFSWGILILIARVAWHADRAALVWGALGLLGALAFGLAMAVRRRPDNRQLRALIDRHSEAGGLVMAADEVDLTAWRSRTPTAAAPAIRWRSGRAWTLVAASAAFVAIAFAVPDALTAMSEGNQLDVSEEVEQLAEQIELLEDERVIESDEAATLTEKLRQIEKEARGADPTKTWEALDHITERVEKEAEQAAEKAVNETERMNRIETLADALRQAGDQLSPEAMAGAMQQLNEQIKDAAAANETFAQSLSKDAAAQLERGTKPESHFDFDVAKMSRLQEKLRELEHLQSTDPADLSPEEMLKLADLARQVSKLSEREMAQLAALEAASFALRQMGVNAIAEIDADANVRFFQPQGEIALAQARDPELGTRFAVRVSGEGRTEQFGETMVLDGDPFQIPAQVFEGEALALTHNDQGKLVVYVGKPSTPVDFEKLGALAGEHIIVNEGGQAPRLYGPDEAPPFDPGALAQACQSAQECKLSRAVMMNKLAGAKMIDPQALAQMQQMMQTDPQAAAALAEFLAQQGGPASPGSLQAALQACMNPGQGGVSRGRGDAPMTWKDPTNLENASFKEQVLPPASASALRDSLKTGTSVSAPELADPDTVTEAGALSGSTAGGGSAQTQTVLPRHRAAVENYFRRE